MHRSARLVAALGAPVLAFLLAGCEEKKTFKHASEWPGDAPATPRPVSTEAPASTADAITARLDDIVNATRKIANEAEAKTAADKMKTAYAELETYVAKLKTQETDPKGPNRQKAARRFQTAQQQLAKSFADLLGQDQKIVEVLSAQLGEMPLIQNPPDDVVGVVPMSMPEMDLETPSPSPDLKTFMPAPK